MVVVTTATDIEILPKVVKFKEVTYRWGAVHGTPPTVVNSRLQSFDYLIKGRRYVDGELVSYWIQYK